MVAGTSRVAAAVLAASLVGAAPVWLPSQATGVVSEPTSPRAALAAPKLSPSAGPAGTLTKVKASGPAESSATLQRRVGRKWTVLGVRQTSPRGVATFQTLLPGTAKPVSYRVRFATKGRTKTTPSARATILPNPPSNPSVIATFVSDDPNHPSQQVMGGALYFAGWVDGRQGLWKLLSPGAKPQLIWGGTTKSEGGIYASMRLAHLGHVYFEYNGQTWVTDGTTAGTAKLTNFSSYGVSPVGNEVLIHAASSSDPDYRSDGSVAGTTVHQRNNDESAFAGGGLYLDQAGLCVYDEPTYVRADDGAHAPLILTGAPCDADFVPGVRFGGREWFGWSATDSVPTLWSTDGSAAGTRQELSSAGLPVPATGDFVVASGLLYFQSDRQVWATDGSASGTAQVPGPKLTRSRPAHLFAYEGGVVSLAWNRNSYRVAAGTRTAIPFPMPVAPAALDEPVGWDDRVVGEWEEYDGFLNEYENKLYAWAPSQPAKLFRSATFVRASRKKGPVSTVFTFDVRATGELLPRPGERVTVLVAGRVIGRPKLTHNYTTRVQLSGRDLGVGTHVVAFQYEGGEQLQPSAPDEVTIRVTG